MGRELYLERLSTQVWPIVLGIPCMRRYILLVQTFATEVQPDILASQSRYPTRVQLFCRKSRGQLTQQQTTVLFGRPLGTSFHPMEANTVVVRTMTSLGVKIRGLPNSRRRCHAPWCKASKKASTEKTSLDAPSGILEDTQVNVQSKSIAHSNGKHS